jgi:hypothetical protein
VSIPGFFGAPASSPVRYRPAGEFPPSRGAQENVCSYATWALAAGGFADVPPNLQPSLWTVPQGSWGRIIHVIFNTVATAAYLTTPNQLIAWRLLRNGVPIPGYDYMIMDAPQSDTVSAKMIIKPTLVFPPGSPQAITVQVLNTSGGALVFAGALIKGWTWPESVNKLWKDGAAQ